MSPHVGFSEKILNWFDQNGRKDLPWQQNINSYRVWVSEIMLQQTQVKTVIPYFERFIVSFPTVQHLANADQDEVLKHWSGLGYYARARNMHKAAKMVCDDFAGQFPQNLESMQLLSGVGRSTAAAILSIAQNQQQAILDGNVKRVLTRFFAVEGWSGKATVLKELWELAENLVPNKRNADYTQAMMDLGATICTRSKPSCENCPLSKGCIAYQEGCQMDFPTKKPKKNLPNRNTIMLLVVKQGEHNSSHVFMVKRPPDGIWGSLWSFPQFDSYEDAENWLSSNLGGSINNADALPIFTHIFSHFRLHIRALKIVYKAPTKWEVMGTNDRIWYKIGKEFSGGIATPVKQLLDILKKEDKNGTNG